MVTIGSEISDIVKSDLQQPSIEGAPENTLGEGTPEHGGEERENVEVQGSAIAGSVALGSEEIPSGKLTGDDWLTALDDLAPAQVRAINSGDGHVVAVVRRASITIAAVPALRIIDSGDALHVQKPLALPAAASAQSSIRVYDGGDARLHSATLAPFPIPDEIIALMVAAARAPRLAAPIVDAPVTDAPATDAPPTDALSTDAPSTDALITESLITDPPATPADEFADLPAGRPQGGLLYRDEGVLVRVVSHLFGSESVDTLRTTGFEWLIGPPNEATIPDFASLAQWVDAANRSEAAGDTADAGSSTPIITHTPARIGRYVAGLGIGLVVALGVWLWPATRVNSTAIVQATATPVAVAEVAPTGLAASLAVVNPDNVTPVPEGEPVAQPAEGAADPAAAPENEDASGTGAVPARCTLAAGNCDCHAHARRCRAPALRRPDLDQPGGQSAGMGPRRTAGDPAARASEENGGIAMPAPVLETRWEPRVVPAIAVALIPDLSTPTPTPAPSPTAPPVRLEPGRIWSAFAPSTEATHFWVGRPHPDSVANQIAAPSYQFGSTGGGRYRPHHGMDIANTFGTPVRAATTGEVVHAGSDEFDILGPYGDFYGNAVVIRLDRRLAVAGGELDVYLLFGHLSEVYVQKGQRVQPDDLIGAVGMTGIAIGPHLHVEMRVGANVYEASVNPYLWVDPGPGNGAVAVRLLTADGRTWPRANVTLARFNGNLATWARVMEIYPDNESINPDPAFGENGAMEAVPAGVYYVVASVNGERVAGEVTVEEGKTSFLELRTKQ